MAEIEAHGVISKIDKWKRQVFGWAYVTHDEHGVVSVDKSGEFMDDVEELEKAAYKFVLNSRMASDSHAPLRKNFEGGGVGTMIESMVFTPEKCEAMGIPAGLLPTGWWVGFQIHDESVWNEVTKGNRPAFSIHGSGTKKEVGDEE